MSRWYYLGLSMASRSVPITLVRLFRLSLSIVVKLDKLILRK